MIKLVIIDDHTLFLEGLRGIFSAEPDLSILGTAGDARQARSLIASTVPDLAVVDIALPGQSGIALIREMHKQRDERMPNILVLSMYDDEQRIIEALEAGAQGYARKSQSVPELALAVRRVARGEQYLPPDIVRATIDEGLRRRRTHRGHTGPLAALSSREREVFELLVQGLGNKEIAAQLFISIKTVETHRAHILRKLSLHSVVGLIRFAAEHALLNSPPAMPQPRVG